MARELEGKVAVVTAAASGIGLASTEAMLAAGSRVVMVDRDEGGLSCEAHCSHDFLPQDFMHIRYSVLQVDPP